MDYVVLETEDSEVARLRPQLQLANPVYPATPSQRSFFSLIHNLFLFFVIIVILAAYVTPLTTLSYTAQHDSTNIHHIYETTK
jgi:hypothetical protein